MVREKLKINPLDLDTVVSSKIRNTDISIDINAAPLSEGTLEDDGGDELDVDALISEMSTGSGKTLDKNSFIKPKNNNKKAA